MQVPINKQSGSINKVMKITGLEDLACTVYSVSETQNYQLPQNPLDNNTFLADTIFRLPKQITVRVLVKEADIPIFTSAINEVQFSSTLFTVVSVANEVFAGLKILSCAKDVSAQMVGAAFYNISMEEAMLIQALVKPYTAAKNPAYGGNGGAGTKQAPERKKSALKGFYS